MSLRAALDRPIVFFGGKGGVGKTTVAAARALEAAARGSRTLLVSTDPAHSAGDVLGVSLGPEPRAVSGSLEAVEIDPAREADRYLAEVIEGLQDVIPPRLTDEVARQFRVARATPGAEEAALFDRFSRIVVSGGFDRIVFDTAPSGHTLRLLTLPDSMGSWMETLVSRRKKLAGLGRMWRNVDPAVAAGADRRRDVVLEALEDRRQRFRAVRDVLCDPKRTAFVFITIAERLSILETERVMKTLREESIPVGGVIVNQVLPEAPRDPFLRRRREREIERLAEIDRRFGDWPIACLPWFEEEPAGVPELTGLLDHLRPREPVERP